VASELLESNERGLGTAPEQLGDRTVHRERRGHASVPREGEDPARLVVERDRTLVLASSARDVSAKADGPTGEDARGGRVRQHAGQHLVRGIELPAVVVSEAEPRRDDPPLL